MIAGVAAFRTPDEPFAELPGFGFAPRYREVGGLRRDVIAPIRDAGDRCIAADHAGFGRSGARALPLIVPTAPDAPGAAAGRRVLEALRDDPRPQLCLWADSDPIIPFAVGERLAAAINAEPPLRIANASHFLQEDAGEEIGRLIAAWLG